VSCPPEAFICDPFRYLGAGVRGLLGFLPEPYLAIIFTVLAVAMVTTLVALIVMTQVWAERRVVGFLQGRLGPNRVGPAGLLQSVADAVKLLMKEIIIPREADRVPYVLAPLVVLVPALMI